MTRFETYTAATATALKCELAGEVLRSWGELRLQVTGWSMLPSLWPGDTLLIERAESNCILAGDIVLFGREGRLFAHRVVSRAGSRDNDLRLIMRGDGMPSPDPPVSSAEVLGRVSLIFRAGECIEPATQLSFFNRVLASAVRSSVCASRILVRLHGLRESSQEQVIPCQS